MYQSFENATPETHVSQAAPLITTLDDYRRMTNENNRNRNTWVVISCLICCIFTLIFVILGGLMIAYSITCSISGNHSTKMYTFYGKEVTSMEFSNQLGSVIFLPSETQTDNITITISRKAGQKKLLNEFHTYFSNKNGVVTLQEKSENGNPWSWIANCKVSEIEVRFPTTFINKPKLRATSIGGLIIANDIRKLSKIQFENFNGEMRLNNLESEIIHADTSNGHVSIQGDINCTNLRIQSNNGAIELKHGTINLKKIFQNSTGMMTVASTNGKISLEGLRTLVSSDIMVHSSNGMIDLVAHNYEGEFDIRSIRGETQTYGDVKYSVNEKYEKKGSVEGTSKLNSTLLVKSSNGNIRVTFDTSTLRK